jgi:hypothetical protein
VLHTTTGVATVIGVDQRFAEIGDGRRGPEHGVTDQARLLVDAAAAAGVVPVPGHAFEHNAVVRKLRDLVRGGRLGRLFYLDCARQLRLNADKESENRCFLCPYDMYQHLSD